MPRFVCNCLLGAHTLLARAVQVYKRRIEISKAKSCHLSSTWFYFCSSASETFQRFQILNRRYFTELLYQMVSFHPLNSMLRRIKNRKSWCSNCHYRLSSRHAKPASCAYYMCGVPNFITINSPSEATLCEYDISSSVWECRMVVIELN